VVSAKLAAGRALAATSRWLQCSLLRRAQVALVNHGSDWKSPEDHVEQPEERPSQRRHGVPRFMFKFTGKLFVCLFI
jgi:hypothetical protein